MGLIIRRKLKLSNIREHHDMFEDAITLKAGRNLHTIHWLVEGNTIDASEPVPSAVTGMTVRHSAHEDGDIHQTVWFKLLAGRGTATIHTGYLKDGSLDNPVSTTYGNLGGVGGRMDCFVAAYTGPDMLHLTELKSQVRTSSEGKATFRVEDDETTVWIQVGTLVDRTTGEAYLWYDFAPPPENDQSDTGGGNGFPALLDGGSGATVYDGCLYFDNPSDPMTTHGTIHKSAWYTWTAPDSSDVTFSASSAAGPTLIGVFDATTTTEIISGQDTVTFTPVGGTTYKIGFGFVASNACGQVSLTWSQTTAFDGKFYVSFDWTPNSTGVHRSTDGLVTFSPSILEFVQDSDFGPEGNGLAFHRKGVTDNMRFVLEFGGPSDPTGYDLVGGTTYHITILFDGIDFVTLWIDPGTGEVQYGPYDITGTFDFDNMPHPWFRYLRLGAGPYGGTDHNYIGTWLYDNVKVGSTKGGAEYFGPADFASAIVPPFDSITDTASEISLVGGQMQIAFPGGGASRDAYALWDSGASGP